MLNRGIRPRLGSGRWAAGIVGFAMLVAGTVFVLDVGFARTPSGETDRARALPTRVEIIAKGVGDLRGVQELNFEKWLEDKPKIVEAVKLSRELSPDDFMTFISLLVEMRYKRDQTALEYVSRFFNRK